MFALARLTRLALLVAVASTVAFTQGCASQEEENGEANAGAISNSESPDRLTDTPFYFSVPKAAVSVPLDRQKYAYSTIWNPSSEVESAGLRMIVIKQDSQDPAAKKRARQDMAHQLAVAGVLQDGDIVLSFRPELAGTMAYPHIQMGVTHASLVYTNQNYNEADAVKRHAGSQAFNIDSPLDGEYVGQFSTLHFTGGTNAQGEREYGTDAFQVIRPRNMDAKRQASLQGWVGKLKSNLDAVHAQVKFQSNYLLPIYAAKRMTPKQTITKLGQIILRLDRDSDLSMYCSEFAWHMNALSACTEDQIRAAGPDGADCVDPAFAPMPLVATTEGQIGLAEGPLSNLLLAPAESQATLIDQLFKTGTEQDLKRLSSGHRAVASQVAPLMDGDANGNGRLDDGEHPALKQYYGLKASHAPAATIGAVAAGLNAGVQNIGNYSPTAFVANATLPASSRAMDYVATIVFTDSADLVTKAKRLAQNPVP